MSEVRLQISVRRRVKTAQNKVSVRINSVCSRRPCKNLKVDHKDYPLLRKTLRQLPNVKKVLSVPVSV